MGNKPKKKFYKRWWFWLIAIMIIVGAIATNGAANAIKEVNSNNGSSADKPKDDAPKKDETPKQEGSKVNYENYSKVAMGQRYEEVAAILGEGSELSSTEIAGISNKMYSWNGDNFSNMNVTMQNGVVIGKAQAGLNTNRAGITLEKYNSVKEGMTVEEVQAILGPGELSSQTQMMGMDSSIYSWINKNGSNANITFQDGKAMMKLHVGLQ